VRVHTAVLVANAALSLVNICSHLPDPQLRPLAKRFEQEGGFTERLYRVREERQRNQSSKQGGKSP